MIIKVGKSHFLKVTKCSLQHNYDEYPILLSIISIEKSSHLSQNQAHQSRKIYMYVSPKNISIWKIIPSNKFKTRQLKKISTLSSLLVYIETFNLTLILNFNRVFHHIMDTLLWFHKTHNYASNLSKPVSLKVILQVSSST